MNRQRYMIFEYSQMLEKTTSVIDGVLVNHLPIHHLLASYHWTRLDETHVLVLGNYSVSQQKHIDVHPHISVLPHLASNKAIHNIVKKQTHWHSLKNALSLQDYPHTMTDVVDEIEAKHGVVFGPLR